jgi:hypothetical protein
MKTKFTLTTKWEARGYDVKGSDREGWAVHDVRPLPDVELELTMTRRNAGTPQESMTAAPSDRQIRQVFGLNNRAVINTDEGDSTHIYVTRTKDGYPIGEMFCISHTCLSPIEPLPTAPTFKPGDTLRIKANLPAHLSEHLNVGQRVRCLSIRPAQMPSGAYLINIEYIGNDMDGLTGELPSTILEKVETKPNA